jgi:purine-binding chemotaxis protein CheW
MSDVYVRFRIGEKGYALPVAHVREVAEPGLLSPVPGAPETVLGVRNLHGQILPVVVLSVVLGMERTHQAPRLVIAEAGDRRAGLTVDEVIDVGELAEDDPVEVLDLETVFAAVQGEAAA